VADITEVNGDWMLEGADLVVTSAQEQPELQIFATDPKGRSWDLTLGTDTTGFSLQNLVGERVTKLVARAAGELRLEFSDGTVLSVSPRDDAEAWEIRREGDPVLIGAPTGGGVIVL
jgi:Family of unknown function (DUF6188)